MDVDDVTCPIEGCDYEGAPASVEAHISGSCQGRHEGEIGRNYTTEIYEQAEGAEPSGPGDALSVALDGSDGEAEIASEDRVDVPEGVAEKVDEGTPGEGASSGIPSPFSPSVMVAVLVGLAVLFWLYQRRQRKRRQAEEERQQQAGSGTGGGF